MEKKKPQQRELNERQRRFVELYMANGNASEAARQAGYAAPSAGRTGGRMLKHALVRAAIAERRASDPRIATREDRQRFWSQVMLGEGEFSAARMADRLKASELLGRTHADFVERFEHTVTEVPPYAPSKRDLVA